MGAQVQAGLSVVDGVMTARHAQKTMDAQNEALRYATLQKAHIEQNETATAISSQKSGYLKSGVELVGSAADVLYDTFSQGQKDVEAMVNDTNQQMDNNVEKGVEAARGALLDGIVGGAKAMGGSSA